MPIDQQDGSGTAPVVYGYTEADVHTPWHQDSLLLVTLSAVLLIDQVAKWLVRANLDLYELWPAQGLIRLTHTENSGAAFSLFRILEPTIFLSAVKGTPKMRCTARRKTAGRKETENSGHPTRICDANLS